MKRYSLNIHKRLKVSILAWVLLAIAVACDNASGNQTKPETPVDNREFKIGNFNFHRFAKVDESINNETLATERFNEAKTFMVEKINAFEKLLENDAAAQAFFGDSTADMFNNKFRYENADENVLLESLITRNNQNYAQFIAKMAYNTIDGNNYNEYYKFLACCDKLNVAAYNGSLGTKQNSTALPTFKTEVAEINAEMTDLGLQPTDAVAAQTMGNFTKQLATQTGAKVTTLNAAIELMGYNEALKGLNDLGKNYYHYQKGDRTRVAFNASLDHNIALLEEQASQIALQNNYELGL